MRVIIVDDEYMIRNDIKDKMEQIKQISEITAFDHPFDALQYASDNHVDVAFLDVEMPDMSGLEMAKRLKSIKPKTNIVFISGFPQYAIDAFGKDASDYLLKPVTIERIDEALNRLRNPVLKPTSRIRVQTFGNFEIFADDKPITFGRMKAKELLAYLIERRGAGITKKVLSSVLWEDGDHSRNKQKNLQTFVSEMMKALKEVDADHIIIKGRDSLSVDVTKIDCDFYRYLAGESRAFNMYMGEFMTNYSWAEFTNASLAMIKEEL